MKCLIMIWLMASPLWAGYSYYISMTPATSQVSSGPHTNFPVLIDVTDNTLRTTGSGGSVTDAQGDDIVPMSDSGCTTALAFEREAYDGTTGRFRAFAKVSSLSSSTTIYLCYGNAAITTSQENVAGTWSAYVAVYHFGDGSTVSMTDSTGSYSFTNSGGTATTGQINGAVAYAAASSQYSYISSAVLTTTPISITAWVKTTTSPGTLPIATIQSAGSNLYMHRLFLYLGKVQAQTQTGDPSYASGLAESSASYSTADWFHAAAVFANGSSRKAYYNGANSGTDTTTAVPVGLNKTQTRTESVDQYMDGSIDELRFANSALSDGWIQTEYNSGIPGTFWDVGSPTAITTGGAVRRRIVQ